MMVVDDEPDVRMLVRLRLELDPRDFRIAAEAGDGKEALQLWRELEAPDPDVVLLDHRMRGLTGIDVAERMLTERPGQLIVLCSGIMTDALRARAAVTGIASCISKRDIGRLPDLVSDLI